MNQDQQAKDAMKLSASIRPMLRGKGWTVQGAALADLVALYFSGHNPTLRDEAITMWLKMMRELIPANEEMMRENFGRMPWDNFQ